MCDFDWGKKELLKLNPENKYETMICTASVITKLLEKHNIQPVIVGGFSVEIYTGHNYSTRDIDFVTSDIKKAREVLLGLGFTKEGRHLFHGYLQVAIEFPDDELAGSHEKISKLFIDKGRELYVYIISYEDIIMDRLRASLYWGDSESKKWGMYILAENYGDIDLDYMRTLNEGAENEHEVQEIEKWIRELDSI